MSAVERRPVRAFIATIAGVCALVAGSGARAQTEVGGRIDADTTWTLAGSPYIVTSDVQVYGDTSPVDAGPHDPVVLTIEAGVEVRFDAGTQLTVANGNDQGGLVAVGAPGTPILFTGNATFPAPDHWDGIELQNGTMDAVTVLQDVVVEFAGAGTGGAGIELIDASPTLVDVVVRETGNDCVSVESGAAPLIQSSTFDQCGRYGIRIDGSSPNVDGNLITAPAHSGIRVSGTSSPTIANNAFDGGIYYEATGGDTTFGANVLNDYASSPSRLPADEVGELLAGATLNGASPDTFLEVVGEGMVASATWPDLGFPYHVVSGDINLDGQDGIPAVLTLDPGVTIKFDTASSGIFVATAGGESAGLLALGTAALPITLTSLAATPARGDWQGIEFGPGTDDANARLEHVVVEYAGQTNNGVEVNSAAPVIQDCTIRESSVHGIHLTGSSTSPQILNNTISGVATNGIRVSATGSPVIDTNVISGSGDYGIRFTGTNTAHDATLTNNTIASGLYFESASGDSTLSGNTITDYDAFPTRIGADDVGELLNLNTLDATPAATLEILGEGVDDDASWPDPGFPLRVLGDVAVRDDSTDTAVLTLAAGLRLEFDSNAELQVGNSSGDLGALVAVGTPSEPIVFTTSNATPAPGQWDGLFFDDSTDDAATLLDQVVIEYGGNTAHDANVRADNSSPTIQNATIRSSGRYGVRLSGTSAGPIVLSSTFSDNTDFDVSADSSTDHFATLDGNAFTRGARFQDVAGETTVTNNTFDGYDGSFNLRVDADSVRLLAGNTFNGTTADSVVEVLGEGLETSGTWLDPGLPYRMVNTTDIAVEGDADNPVTLTLAAGVEIQFNTDGRLFVADSSNQGALIAVGTESDPIRLTSSQPAPARGDFEGVRFDAATVDATSILDHVIIEYAGAAGSYCIAIVNASPTIRNLTCRETANSGIRLNGSSSPTIELSEFDGLDDDGIRVESTASGAPLIQNNVIRNTGRYGIYFERESQASVRGNTISQIADYGIYFAGTSGTADVEIADNGIEHGIHVADDGLGGRRRITGNQLTALAGFSPRVRATGLHQLVNFNELVGLDPADRIEVHGGTISRRSRWVDAGVPYRVISSDITVQGPATSAQPAVMKVEPGVTIEFDSGRRIRVGSTSGGEAVLRAVATETEPITFTSSAATPAPGDWEGITFDATSRDDLCLLDGVVVEYGGQSSSFQANVRVDQASPTIRNSVLRHSSQHGIRVDDNGSSPVVEGNTFTDNADYDVYFDDTTDATVTGNAFTNGLFFRVAGGDPTIESNVFDDYADHFLRVGAAEIATLGTNTFNGASAAAVVEILGERISTSAQWLDVGVPYHFLSGSDTEIYGSSFAPATVTIQPGTVLKFDGVRLRVGRTGSADRGALVADGTPALPITFTSALATPAAGDWRGIYFDSRSDNDVNLLDNVVVEYGGQTYNANVRFSSSAGTVSNSDIRSSSRYGIYSGTTNEDALVVQGNDFADNSDYDVFFASSGATDAEVTGNTFTNGLRFDDDAGDPVVQDNVFSDYVDHFVRVGASSLDDFTGNTFPGASADAVLEVHGERIASDATWLRLAVPYRIVSADVSVYGDTSEVPAVLTIAQGTTIQFDPARRIRVSTTSSSQRGTLIAQGTGAQPITFTSSSATPAPGDWEGITFDSGWDSADSLLEFVVIEYGGETYSGNVRLNGASPTIRSSIIRHSSVYGVNAASGTSSPVIDATTFENNADWDLRFVGTSNATITDNTFPSGVFFADTGGHQTLTGNAFQGYDGTRNLRIGASSIDTGFETNTFTGLTLDSRVEIAGESWGESRTWPALAFPYEVVSGDVEMFSTSSTPVMTLEAGVRIEFGNGSGLRISTGSNDAAALVVAGTELEPVVLTSSSDTPAAGDWDGVVFGDGTDGPLTVLDWLVVEYGGAETTDRAGIRINGASPTIRNCRITDSIEFGFYATRSSGSIADNSPTIDGCTFANNADFDVFFTSDQRGDVVITNNTFTNGVRFDTEDGTLELTGNTFDDYNTDHFLRVGADALGTDFATNTFNATDATSVIEIIGETLTESTVWPAFTFPYRVVGDQGGDIRMTSFTSTPVLTLEAGLTVRFDSGRGLRISDDTDDFGALVIAGTDVAPVLLTSSAATPAPGDWEGVFFGDGTDGALSLLEHATIEYAGQTDSAAIRVNSSASPTIRDCTLAQSSVYGVYSTTGNSTDNSPLIERVTFTGNADFDIFYASGHSGAQPVLRDSTLEHGAWFDDADAVVENNTFQEYNDGFWLKLPALQVSQLTGNVFDNPVAESVILVEGNNAIDVDLTWPDPGVPYQLTERDITVFKDGITPATLTLEPGVEIRFELDRGLNIGTSSQQGGLIAVGTMAAPIVFTTADVAAPAPGQWESIDFRQATSFATELDWVVVEYGGQQDGANVRIQSSSPTIRNATIRHSSGRGVRSDAGTAVIETSTISDNGTYGVWDDGSSELVLTDNTFTANADYDVYFTTTSNAVITGNGLDGGLFFASASGQPTVTGNTFTLDDAFPIRVGADTVEQMAANTYAGVTAASVLEVIGQRLSADAVWADLGFPYEVVSGTVHAYLDSSAPATLTLLPGVEIRFAASARLRIANGSSQGALVAVGTAAEPIVLTSAQETPAAGDWNGVRFDSGTIDATTRLEWVVVDYAGGADSAAIYATSADPTIADTTVRNSSGHGIRLSSSDAEVSFTTLESNASYGVQTESSASPRLRHNRFVGNVAGGLNHTSSNNVDARLNWWGAADGPSGAGGGAGQSVSSAVVFAPWLETDVAAITGEDFIVDLFQTTPTFRPGSRTRYFAEFAEETAWTLDLVDNVGGVVRSFSGTGTELVQDFDGRDTGGVDLVDGTYEFRLSGSGTGSGAAVAVARGEVAIDASLPVGEIDSVLHLDVFAEGAQVPVEGSAELGGFTSYTLQYGTGLFPTSFSLINSEVTPVAADVLGTWNTNNLTSGIYSLRLLVDNDLTEQTVVNLGSLVLAVNSLSVDRAAFSPNGDGVQDDVTVNATLSVPADWTIDVQDGLGATVRSFAGSGSRVEQVWDGTLAGGAVAAEDTYTFAFEAMADGAMVAQDTATSILDVTAPSATITAPPDGGEAWSTVDVVGTADDPNGNFQDYLLQFGPGPSPVNLTNIGGAVTTPVVDDVLGSWVTNDDEPGEVVVNGEYQLRLTASDIAGNSSVATIQVALDNLILGNVAVSAEQFNPTLGETVTVDYSINKPADVTLTIYPEDDGSAGVPWRTIAQAVPGEGDYAFLWDGTDEGGVVVPDEAYVYVLDAATGDGRTDTFDPSGGRGIGANSGSIPSTYNPFTNDFWSIDLNVSTGGRVRMTVTPSGESGFQVVDRFPYLPGVYEVIWDGRRPDGSIVEQSVNVFFDPPTTLRPHHVLTDGDTPDIVTVASDPYLAHVSYGQVSDLEYSLAIDAVVTVKVLPAGIFDPGSPEALTLVADELQPAGDQVVFFAPLDPADPNENEALSETEGAYSFTIEAVNPSTGRSELRYGVINVYR